MEEKMGWDRGRVCMIKLEQALFVLPWMLTLSTHTFVAKTTTNAAIPHTIFSVEQVEC